MFVEPGIDQTLNPIIAQIGQTIKKIQNPLEDYQLNMLSAISQKPELLQSFANMEHLNPGTLKRMGFGVVGDLMGSVGPDLDTQYQKQYGKAAVKAKGQTTENEATV